LQFAHGADGGSRGLCCVLVLGGGGGGDGGGDGGGGDGGGGEQRCDHDHETASTAAMSSCAGDRVVRFCSMLKRTMKSRATSDGARRGILQVLSSRLQSARGDGER